MTERVTFTHEGVEYEVLDWRYIGVQRKRVTLNSPYAEGRAFLPVDRTHPVRIFLYRGGINYQKSDPATLAEQFRLSEPGRWNR